jgi:RNA polymerase sigma factor (sigma-70 family)
MPHSPHPAAPEADELAELYATLGDRLVRIVRRDVRAPDTVIEDACQFAWSRLVHHRERVRRETALPWLVTTAVREAIKLIRREAREASLEELIERAGEPRPAAAAPGLEEVVGQRARLEAIRQLPERQQRLVWLQALGLSYAEMSGCTGATPRTVERQLLRAKRALHAA